MHWTRAAAPIFRSRQHNVDALGHEAERALLLPAQKKDGLAAFRPGRIDGATWEAFMEQGEIALSDREFSRVKARVYAQAGTSLSDAKLDTGGVPALQDRATAAAGLRSTPISIIPSGAATSVMRR